MRDVLMIIDMQAGSFGPACPPRHDTTALVERVKELAQWVRAHDGSVVWVQHDGAPGDVLEPGTDGWQILPSLRAESGHSLFTPDRKLKATIER